MAADQASIAAGASAGLDGVNVAIDTVGRLQNAGLKVLSTVSKAVESAMPAYDAGVAALEADVVTDSVGGVAAGLAAPDLAAALGAQAATMIQLARLVTARAYLARAGVNVEQAPG